jgi:hypothetical protein
MTTKRKGMQHFFSNTTKIKEVIMAFNNLGTPVTLGPGGQIIAFMSYGGDHGAQILAPNIIQNGAPEGDGESEITRHGHVYGGIREYRQPAFRRVRRQ